MSKFAIEKYDGLFEAVLKIKDIKGCRMFFEDVFTIKELEDINQRLEVAKMLTDGKNYQEITKATGASTATISRVSKCLNYGQGGYSLVLGNKQKKGKGQ